MIQRLRVPLGFVIAVVVLYFATPTPRSIDIGVAIALMGVLFRALAAGVIKKDSHLATSGIYSWTRNPLYLGSSLIAAGFAIMSWNILAAALLVIPSLGIYPRVIRNEEAHLEGLFGDSFRAYRETTPAFIPLPRPMKPSFSFRQYLANREYNTALGFIAAVTVLALKVSR